MVVCCGIVGRGACTQSLLVSVLLVYYSLSLSSRDFSGLTPHAILGVGYRFFQQLSHRFLAFVVEFFPAVK